MDVVAPNFRPIQGTTAHGVVIGSTIAVGKPTTSELYPVLNKAVK